MKKNRELKYEEPKKVKLTKVNYVVIILPILFILLLVSVLAYYVFVYNNDSNKMKRYLENDGYVCNRVSCTKEVNQEIYTIDYVDEVMMVDSTSLQVRVGKSVPVVDIKDKGIVCTYIKDNYNLDLVDETFRYDRECGTYVMQVNRYLTYYKEIRQKALA